MTGRMGAKFPSRRRDVAPADPTAGEWFSGSDLADGAGQEAGMTGSSLRAAHEHYHRLRPVDHAQFGEDRAQVVLHRLLRDLQSSCYQSVRHASDEQLGHIRFAFGESDAHQFTVAESVLRCSGASSAELFGESQQALSLLLVGLCALK